MLARFAATAVAYTLLATLAWWLTHDAAASACASFAKLLHAIIGLPAPYLIADVADLWWLAPPAQLFVGLVLASAWIRWPVRLTLLLVGISLFWFITSMTIVIACSPYIGMAPGRQFVSIMLTKSLLVVVPTILWLMLCGIPRPAAASRIGSRGEPDDDDLRTVRQRLPAEAGRGIPLAARAAVSVSACLVLLPLTGLALATTATADIREARSDLASALRGRNHRAGIGHAIRLGDLELARGGQDLTLIYLAAKLCQESGDIAAARHLVDRAPGHAVLAPLRRELGS